MLARENPFSTRYLERLRFRAPGVTLNMLLEKFGRMGRRAAIVGPEGSGKTTLLLELAGELRRRGEPVILLRGGEAQARDIEVAAEAVVVLDESDMLGPIAWRRFLAATRGTAGLLITTHRGGRLPPLIECATSAGLLEELAVELTGGAMNGTQGRLGEIYRRHDGNIREALLELYDIAARRGAS